MRKRKSGVDWIVAYGSFRYRHLFLMHLDTEQTPHHSPRVSKIYENYGHFGDDRKVPGYIMFDWGSGSSASAAAYVERRYGDVYVDKRSRGFGINGCIVDRVVIKAGKLVSLEIKKRMLRAEEMVVTIN